MSTIETPSVDEGIDTALQQIKRKFDLPIRKEGLSFGRSGQSLVIEQAGRYAIAPWEIMQSVALQCATVGELWVRLKADDTVTLQN